MLDEAQEPEPLGVSVHGVSLLRDAQELEVLEPLGVSVHGVSEVDGVQVVELPEAVDVELELLGQPGMWPQFQCHNGKSQFALELED